MFSHKSLHYINVGIMGWYVNNGSVGELQKKSSGTSSLLIMTQPKSNNLLHLLNPYPHDACHTWGKLYQRYCQKKSHQRVSWSYSGAKSESGLDCLTFCLDLCCFFASNFFSFSFALSAFFFSLSYFFFSLSNFFLSNSSVV